MKNSKLKIIFILAILCGVLLLPRISQAATYYIATNGNDSNPGTETQPWATFSKAFSIMSGGDTLIIKDGIYYQSLYNPPSGTADQYTVVKAEHDGKVIIDGTLLPTGTFPLGIIGSDRKYITIEGIKFVSSKRDAGFIGYASHIKVKRSAFYDSYLYEPTGETNNYSTFGTNHASYLLVEDCWAWGGGRYKFLAFESNHIIFRRCVARHDRMDTAYPQSLFSIYRSSYTQLQNCIGIDSDQDVYYTGYSGWYGGIFSPNNTIDYPNTGLKVLGSIILKVSGRFAFQSQVTFDEQMIKNSLFWDTKGGIGYWIPTNASVMVDHVTIGNVYGTFSDSTPHWGVGIRGLDTGFTTQNSIIYGANSYGIYTSQASDYNDLYANKQNYYKTNSGANDRYINPNLKYITRIENDSPLKGAASDGGDIGANIIYRYGVSGTLWGEPGYDQLTNEPLWPFPNEDQIKKDMASFVGPPSGKRGFCADGTGLYGGPITLTSYIWEYLGNPCPPEICNYGITDTTPPAPPTGVTVI